MGHLVAKFWTWKLDKIFSLAWVRYWNQPCDLPCNADCGVSLHLCKEAQLGACLDGNCWRELWDKVGSDIRADALVHSQLAMTAHSAQTVLSCHCIQASVVQLSSTDLQSIEVVCFRHQLVAICQTLSFNTYLKKYSLNTFYHSEFNNFSSRTLPVPQKL